MKGAGGSDGGMGRFLIGFVMICGGGYLFLDAIRVTTYGVFGQSMGSLGGFQLTSGMVLIPFILGVGIIFYSAKNIIGWLLAAGSVVALGFGVIANTHFRFRNMSAFDLLLILVLFVGGIGILLSSLKEKGGREGPS